MTGTDFFCNHNCSSLQQLPDRTEQVLNRAGERAEVVASLSQGRTAAAQCGLFTHKSVPVIFEPPCITNKILFIEIYNKYSHDTFSYQMSLFIQQTCHYILYRVYFRRFYSEDVLQTSFSTHFMNTFMVLNTCTQKTLYTNFELLIRKPAFFCVHFKVQSNQITV